MFRGKTLVYGLVLVLAVAGSIALLRPRLYDAFPSALTMKRCSKTDTVDGAYRADLRFLSGGLGSERNLVQLTDGMETASEVISNLRSYRALVVVTAGRSTLTRRNEDQPFISIARDPLDPPRQDQPQQQEGFQEQQPQAQHQGQQEQDHQELAEQRQAKREQQEQGQEREPEPEHGRRRRALIADEEDVGDSAAAADAKARQAAGGGGAVPPYGSGLAALAAAASLMNSAAAAVERVLSRRLFPITISLYDRTAGGTVASGPYAVFDASAGLLLLDEQLVSYTWADDKPQVSYIAGQLASRVFTQMAEMLRPGSDSRQASAAANAATTAEPDAGAAKRSTFSSAAAAAAQIAAAAVAAALPAAFAAAPPLWFCILCPSVLGLLTPLLINLALNQVAGLLCSQLHLTDDACFDVLLGALGAGFVLSLASAVPIFFVCRLPECGGHNVTAALRRLLPLQLPRGGGAAVAAATTAAAAAAAGFGL